MKLYLVLLCSIISVSPAVYGFDPFGPLAGEELRAEKLMENSSEAPQHIQNIVAQLSKLMKFNFSVQTRIIGDGFGIKTIEVEPIYNRTLKSTATYIVLGGKQEEEEWVIFINKNFLERISSEKLRVGIARALTAKSYEQEPQAIFPLLFVCYTLGYVGLGTALGEIPALQQGNLNIIRWIASYIVTTPAIVLLATKYSRNFTKKIDIQCAVKADMAQGLVEYLQETYEDKANDTFLRSFLNLFSLTLEERLEYLRPIAEYQRQQQEKNHLLLLESATPTPANTIHSDFHHSPYQKEADTRGYEWSLKNLFFFSYDYDKKK